MATGAMKTTDTRGTRERLLDAGEMLFAEHGFAGASVRAITTAAGTNLNAINYHFGSKERLLQVVVHRVLGPINEEQLQRLDDLGAEKDQAGGEPSVEELIDAYASPFVDLLEHDKERARVVFRLLTRTLADAGGSFDLAALDEGDGSEDVYLRAFAHALPHLSREELWWRFQANRVVIASHWVLLADSRSPETEGDIRTWMFAYLTAAMSAPSGALSADATSWRGTNRQIRCPADSGN